MFFSVSPMIAVLLDADFASAPSFFTSPDAARSSALALSTALMISEISLLLGMCLLHLCHLCDDFVL